ncbi:MAG: hypothetical protein VKK04_07420 [Synechococcales bacterium]|nr:hypothetical protein [Synechococcales bacterium]
MYDPLHGIANIIKSSAEAIEKTGIVTVNIINTSLYGRYVQRPGESDEAYEARLNFLKEKQQKKQENKEKRQESKKEKRLQRQQEREARRAKSRKS